MFNVKEIEAARAVIGRLPKDDALYKTTFDIDSLLWTIQVYTLIMQPWFCRHGHDLFEVAAAVAMDLEMYASAEKDE